MRRVLCPALLLAVVAAAQTPRIGNAKLETRAASSLAAEVQAAQSRNTPMWLGYAVEAVREQESCCYWNGRSGCSLEGENSRNSTGAAPTGPVMLEAGRYMMVMVRFEAGAVSKVHPYSLNCELDGGGLPVVWLTGVKVGESLQFLKGQVSDRKGDGAIAAIASHKGPEADQLLESFLTQDQPVEIRRKACFWLGNQRGAHGVQVLQRVVRDDPSDKVREHAVFALSHSKEPAGLETVLRVAKEDKSAHVRGQALFWLAQKAGEKAIGPISNAIEQDPDTQVKRQAVFALTQLPNNEGVPKLIQVARDNRNPAVRKQAYFWLGQSKDPRATQFLEEVLTK